MLKTPSKIASSFDYPRYRRLSLVPLAVLLLCMPAAAAPSEADRSIAQSLFEDARRLMSEHDFAAACPKLAESNRLDPSGGTVLNLALCREQEGKLATAWTYFKQALSAARRDGRADRQQAAETHLAALEGRVPSVKISVVKAQPSEEIQVDGQKVGPAAWGTSMALDPGEHRVSARVPGSPEWTQSFELTTGQVVFIEVPEFPPAVDNHAADTGPAGPDDKAAPAAEDGGNRTLGWVLAGSGVVAIGVGSFFGLDALSKQNKSDDECPTRQTCSDRGVELSHQANTSAWVANTGIGVGLASALAGTYFILSAPSHADAAGQRGGTVLHVAASDRSASVTLRGSW
jgi:hypothetical protein